DRAYNETCAAIASFQWSWRLLLATGDARYADHMERVLYNGFAGATATGGTRFFYVNPLQRRADHFEKDDPGRRREGVSCEAGRAHRCRVPDAVPAVAARRCAAVRTGSQAAAGLPGPPDRRGARDRGNRARPAGVLLRAGRPARRGCSRCWLLRRRDPDPHRS